jgi:hypothetical protein
MPFEKNHKLSIGRPKGSKDKIGSDVKSLVRQFVSDYLGSSQCATDWIQLTPYERFSLVQRLSSPLIPREVSIGNFSTTSAAELLAMSPEELADYKQRYNHERQKAIDKGATIIVSDEEDR